MERWHFARHLNFTALLNPSDAKRQLLLVATLDQVEVANFKNLKRQHPVGKHTLRVGREGWKLALSIHFDVGLLDKSAKALKFLAVESAELFGADVAWLTAKAFESGLHVGQFDDASQFGLKLGHHIGGVPAVTKTPYQVLISNPDTPASARVGTLGNSAERCGVVTANGLNLPALI